MKRGNKWKAVSIKQCSMIFMIINLVKLANCILPPWLVKQPCIEESAVGEKEVVLKIGPRALQEAPSLLSRDQRLGWRNEKIKERS